MVHMAEQDVSLGDLERYTQANEQAQRALRDARAELDRTGFHFERANRPRGKAMGYLKWIAELNSWVEASVHAEIAKDDLAAIRRGRTPVSDSEPAAMVDLPRTTVEARARLRATSERYRLARHGFDAAHEQARSEWIAAMFNWSLLLNTEQARAAGVGAAAGEYDEQAAEMLFVDAPRCPRHRTIVLNARWSRRPGWCVICKKCWPLPPDDSQFIQRRSF
jgi:hypothetical protein